MRFGLLSRELEDDAECLPDGILGDRQVVETSASLGGGSDKQPELNQPVEFVSDSAGGVAPLYRVSPG